MVAEFMATAMSALVGREVEVRLADSSAYSGILHSFSPGQCLVLTYVIMTKAGDGGSDETNGEPRSSLKVLIEDVVNMVDVKASSALQRDTQLKESKLNKNATEFYPAPKKPAPQNLMGHSAPIYPPHYENFGSALPFPQSICRPVGSMMQRNGFHGHVGSMMQDNGFPGPYYGPQTQPYVLMNPHSGMNYFASGFEPFYPASQHVRFPAYQGYPQGQEMHPPYSVPCPSLYIGPPVYPVPRHFPAYHPFPAPGYNGFINSSFRS